MVLGKGCYIYRATPITNISDINDSKRLSYKPASLNKTYQRASTPFNTMQSSCKRMDIKKGCRFSSNDKR